MFCVSEYRLFVKQGYGVQSAIDLGYKNALLLTENVCSAYTKSAVLDCIDTTSIKSIFYIVVCLTIYLNYISGAQIRANST